MTRVTINPGVCGFIAQVDVERIDEGKVSVVMESQCERIARLAESLKELSAWDPLKPGPDSEVHRQAGNARLHAACPVPCGILKAVEVEAGLALPRDVDIRLDSRTVEPGS